MAEWNPWQTLESLRREIDRVFDDSVVRQEAGSRAAFLPGRAARRYPLINFAEDQEALYVEALAPGVEPGTLDVHVLRNTLTISGEKRRVVGDVKPEAFHRSERATGKFVRNIDLPVEVDEHKVQADYKNGILTIVLPKTEKARPKQIAVQIA